ncbi:hypothetical protein C9374_013050 [Naegleria lovaniensis]|uniref:Calcineurin-like phosphoesterase domain-containing protein n=1 Tax=Naegleria lovaniensis TaxID=51637 RepID=A0AA88GDQ0_NAELO|nr:uncharacterized protein C9374_013050 [Naegleria lovaniensis]KAG2372928.1 hypothetical protein C9374_013050 [Naegleria lovaniensis]
MITQYTPEVNHDTKVITNNNDEEASSPVTITPEMTTCCEIKVPQRNNPKAKPLRFVVVSDTHLNHETVEMHQYTGDVLIHCGDFTNKGTKGEVDLFFQYLLDQCDGKFKYIIMIVGNHEWAPDIVVRVRFNKFFKEKKVKSSYHLLLDEHVTILDDNNQKIKIFGSRFRASWRFPPLMRDSLRKSSFQISKDIDMLLTHFPPCKNGLDIAHDDVSRGSPQLTDMLDSNYFENLKIHCFGHNHCTRGHHYEEKTDRMFVNAASTLSKKKKIVAKPYIFDF